MQDKSSETRVRIPYYRNLDPLNPLVPLRRTERHLLRQCLSGLTRYDAVQGKIIPDIAHYWTHNDDFTRWEFWLKSTARFADGSELDASAVQRCLLAASQSPQFAPLFSPIKTITADAPWHLVIETHHPVRRLDCLLATQPTMLFDYQHGHIRRTGAFHLQEHSNNFMVLRRNQHWHQARPGLDEITIFTWAPEHISMSFIPLMRGEEAQDDRPLNERSLEQGCCFVLLDSDGAFADEAGRRFINYLLQPVELLSQTQLPDEYARILSVAQGMLPQWNHRPVDFGGITAPFNLRQPVIISTSQLKTRHIAGYIHERLAQGISLRTLQNEMAMVRSILAEAGRMQLSQSELISNKSLGISVASRDGTHRAIPDALYQQVQDRVRQTDPGLAASLQLARVMGLRGQEAVQCCQSLKTWDKQLEKGAERLSVIFGTKGGRPRITQVIDREAVRQAVKEALNIAGKRDGHLIDKPDLKSAMDYWHNHLRDAGLTGEYSPHSLRYAWAQDAI